MEVTEVRTSHPRRDEPVCHASRVGSVLLGFHGEALRSELMKPRPERAIGAIYRPETDRASLSVAAHPTRQLDEYVWLDESHALRPLESHEVVGRPDADPFGRCGRGRRATRHRTQRSGSVDAAAAAGRLRR
jgi:protein-L-isoaspartate(D-aspartate) O-methyltransferase